MKAQSAEFRTKSIDKATRVCACRHEYESGKWTKTFPLKRVELRDGEAWFVFHDPGNRQLQGRRRREVGRRHALRELRRRELDARQIPLFPEEPP